MYLPGASTIGIVCKDGVILASEKRVTYGYMIQSKKGKKVFKITENIGAACAGLVADMQIMIREVSAYAKLYELDKQKKITVKSTAKMMSNILFQRRLLPYITQTIIGGIDNKGASIYVLDALGSLIPDKYAAVGSGAEIALGVLESEYKEGLNVNRGKELALKTIKAAVARDIASGDGADILSITKEEITEETVPLAQT
jgi:proteasome beta subunit